MCRSVCGQTRRVHDGQLRLSPTTPHSPMHGTDLGVQLSVKAAHQHVAVVFSVSFNATQEGGGRVMAVNWGGRHQVYVCACGVTSPEKADPGW